MLVVVPNVHEWTVIRLPSLHEMSAATGMRYSAFQPVLTRYKLLEIERRRKQGKGNFLYIRYADDFVVLGNGTKAEAHAMKEELKGILSTMGLMLSGAKTKVSHITEGFTFLGYRVIRSMGRNGKMVTKIEIPEVAIKKFQQKI